MPPGPPARRHRRAAALLTALLALFAAPRPAAADPATPTDYRSEVDLIDPSTDGVVVDVVGSDAFMRVTAEPGHEVVVIGYYDEPYARITADGSVELNEASPSVLQNTERFGIATDDVADASAAPRWVPTGETGSFVWHDHRSHWMSPTDAAVDAERIVQRWELPLVIDGASATVSGTLYRDPAPSPAWWLGVVLGAVAAIALGSARRAWLACASAGAMTVLLAVDLLSLPGAARPSWAPVVVAAIGTLALASGAARSGRWWSDAVVAGGAVGTAFAAVLSRGVLTSAYLPGSAPEAATRVAVAVALGAALVTAVTATFAATGIRLRTAQ